MADYLFLYRNNQKQETELSMEEMQEHMGKWHEWIGNGLKAGWMTNPGDALQPQGKVVRENQTVTDGPFTESKEIIGGYSIVTADDLDAAAKLTSGCPIFESGGFVEVRELAKVAIETPEATA